MIGRDPDASAHGAVSAISVGLDEKSVSKSHALVELVDGVLRARDLGSVNGLLVVHVDGRESEPEGDAWVTLLDGDELELGHVVVTVRKA
ncbi:MAG: FHA domain-containing protein [Actinobacteria bacterium]|nr:FHA domain-containing protein [Actinomycetota bacterium]MBU1607920.1 FHA domain-containing protein [Actinomycetota bacterium]MBU2316096.1 FHA domain-containing protein [Actinomycetota bacterium]MBU2386044.1 FHA domain-containing protein [Actinomycetota bacterium]